MSKTAAGARRTRPQGKPGRRGTKPSRRRRRIHPLAALAGLIVLLGIVAAFITTGSSGRPEDPVTADVRVSGEALPRFQRRTVDAAIGMQAPQLAGIDFDRRPIAIGPTGRPTVILFLAHWCPHCRREVPTLQAWLAQNGVPSGVDLYSVSSYADRARPNYPPGAWLREEGWSVPVLVDDADSRAAESFGLSGTPFWIFLDGQGRVLQRVESELGGDGLVSWLQRLGMTPAATS